jgi:DNA-binding MarR family transcriptional regulator
MSNGLNTKHKSVSGRTDAQVVVEHRLMPQLLGYELRLAQQAVFRDFATSVGALGITAGRVGVLLLVEANPGVAQSPLARTVGLDRSSLVPILDQLESAGWLERRAGTDRRSNGLWLTEAGQALLGRVKSRVRAHEKRIASRLRPDERTELMRLLRRLRGAD